MIHNTRFREPPDAPVCWEQKRCLIEVLVAGARIDTVGDHIRRRRLGLKILQRDVAERIGVGETSVFKWEANTGSPEIRYMPAIIDLPGYDPLPQANTLAEQLIRQRTTLGLSQKEASERLGVDPGNSGAVGAGRMGAHRSVCGAGETIPRR